MKYFIVIIVFLGSMVSVLSKADQATGDIFQENVGSLKIGKNRLRGTDCAIEIRTKSPSTLYYTFEYTDDLYLNSISSGHFSKQVFAERLFHSNYNIISCWFVGRCQRGSLEITYNKKKIIKSLESYDEDKNLIDECDLTD